MTSEQNRNLEDHKLELDLEQQKAVALSLDTQNRLVGVTGKAGTGKTSILLTICEAFEQAGYNVVLCAPTGKAARRIHEATGRAAKTIHRLLEYPRPRERDEKTGKYLDVTIPKRGRESPLTYDIVLADEYAMVSQEVHRNLVSALPRGGVLRVFGDVNQLRPIERRLKDRLAPSPFQSILEKFPSVALETIHRQGEGSGIAFNGDRIIRGRMPQRADDFSMHFTPRPVDALLSLVSKDAETFRGLNAQIITPVNVGWIGTIKLNEALQRKFQPHSAPFMQLERHSWVKHALSVTKYDKIIWTQNDYTLDIMNGETGIVVDIDFDEETLWIDFGDRIVELPSVIETIMQDGGRSIYNPHRSIELAYAITTHKAQGSEYARVVYVLNRSVSYMLCRPNLYTGVTRARTKVDIVTDQRAITQSLANEISIMDRKDMSKNRPMTPRA